MSQPKRTRSPTPALSSFTKWKYYFHFEAQTGNESPSAATTSRKPFPVRGSRHGKVEFEGLIAQQLRAWLHYRQGDAELFFWRTRGGAEVDFVLYGDLGLVAVEAKYSARVRSEDLRHLKAFKADYPEATCHFVYAGSERLLIDGILCLPADEFLKGLVVS